jgi:hypothetical protein
MNHEELFVLDRLTILTASEIKMFKIEWVPHETSRKLCLGGHSVAYFE